MSEVVDEKDERAYKGTGTQLEGEACGAGLPASIRFQLVLQASFSAAVIAAPSRTLFIPHRVL